MARIVQPLTSTQVDKAKYKQGGRNELNDGGGLFLQLNPIGTKSWRFRYENPITKKRTKLTIGNYPSFSLAQARTKREELRALLAQDIDPKTYFEHQRIAAQASQYKTFLSVAEQWKEKREKEVEPTTIRKNWECLNNHLFPFIGNYPIEEITSPLLIQTLKRLDEQGKNNTLHRLFNLTNQIMNYAVTVGILEFNRCQNAAGAYHKEPHKHHNAIHYNELPQLLADFENSIRDPLTKLLFRWELLTMVRPFETVSVEWKDIDLEQKLWSIPPEKMKKVKTGRFAHFVPLSSQALAILEKLKPITGQERFVFPSLKKPNRPMSRDTVPNALRKIGYKDIQTAHGLRSIGRTYLEDKMIDFRLSESCLAHKIGDKVS